MKSILVPGASIILILYVILFLVDHQFWPEETSSKVRNIIFVLFALYISYDLSRIYVFKKEKEETALVYRVGSSGKKVYAGITDHIRPFQKEFLIWLAVATGLAFLGFVLMGIPGYLWMEIPVKLGLANRIQGDNLWPATLYMSFLWPFFLPAGVLVKHALIRQGYAQWALTGWIGTVVGGIVFLLVMTYWMFGVKTK